MGRSRAQHPTPCDADAQDVGPPLGKVEQERVGQRTDDARNDGGESERRKQAAAAE